jgi:hypothetical protein
MTIGSLGKRADHDVFRQPVAGRPHFGNLLLTAGNQAWIRPKSMIFRRLLAVFLGRRQVSSWFFCHIEANWHQLRFLL